MPPISIDLLNICAQQAAAMVDTYDSLICDIDAGASFEDLKATIRNGRLRAIQEHARWVARIQEALK